MHTKLDQTNHEWPAQLAKGHLLTHTRPRGGWPFYFDRRVSLCLREQTSADRRAKLDHGARTEESVDESHTVGIS
jgi:hypothetical protein